MCEATLARYCDTSGVRYLILESPRFGIASANAILGTSQGTAFVEVTDPGAARIVAVIPGPVSLWRDIRTYQHWAYAVSEAGGGVSAVVPIDLHIRGCPPRPTQLLKGLLTLLET